VISTFNEMNRVGINFLVQHTKRSWVQTYHCVPSPPAEHRLAKRNFKILCNLKFNSKR
jgi:hypothetical protein